MLYQLSYPGTSGLGPEKRPTLRSEGRV
jgi:hypothetical protein